MEHKIITTFHRPRFSPCNTVSGWPPCSGREGRTGDGHGHGAEVAGRLVQVQAVALEQQVHVGPAEVIRRVPKVEGSIGDPANATGRFFNAGKDLQVLDISHIYKDVWIPRVDRRLFVDCNKAPPPPDASSTPLRGTTHSAPRGHGG